MPKGAKRTNCIACGKQMQTVRTDGKATCIPCRHAAQVLKPGETPCAFSECRYARRFTTGYCGTHHKRFLKYGDASKTMKGKAHAVKYTADGLRVCSKCSTPKPESKFHRDKGGSNGRRAACAECELAIEKSRYEGKRDSILIKMKEYRELNLTALRERDRQRYERDREKRIELATMHTHLRRARLKATVSDTGISVIALRKRFGDNCQYCKIPLDFKAAKRGTIAPARASVEHVLPLSKGGTHTWDNVTLICHRCNTSKNCKTLDEWTPSGIGVDPPVMVGQLALFPLSEVAA